MNFLWNDDENDYHTIPYRFRVIIDRLMDENERLRDSQIPGRCSGCIHNFNNICSVTNVQIWPHGICDKWEGDENYEKISRN